MLPAVLRCEGCEELEQGLRLLLLPVTCTYTHSGVFSSSLALLSCWCPLGTAAHRKLPEGTQGTVVTAWALGWVERRDGWHMRAGAGSRTERLRLDKGLKVPPGHSSSYCFNQVPPCSIIWHQEEFDSITLHQGAHPGMGVQRGPGQELESAA